MKTWTCLLLILVCSAASAHAQQAVGPFLLPPVEIKLERLPSLQTETVIEFTPFLQDVLPPPYPEKPGLEENSEEPDSELTEEEKQEIVEKIEMELIEILRASPWSGSIEFGLNGTEGNSNSFNLRFGAKARRKTENNTFSINARHANNSSRGIKTANNFLFDSRSEWPFHDTPWTYFAHGTGEMDEFKAFDIRLAGDTGLGYKFVDEEATSVIGRMGGSVSKETGSMDDEYTPELSLSTEWKIQISPRQKMTSNIEYFPDVTNFQAYRLNTRAAWEIVVDPEWGLSLKFSLYQRYDSTPSSSRKTDTDFAALLSWSF